MGLNVCESRLNVPIYPIFQTFNPFTLEIKWVGVLKVWNPPKYLGVHISNFEKNTSCTCKVFNTLHLNTWGPYIQLRKNTSCTCKVFNTLPLNIWGSIYPTSKIYFLHVQSIEYFAPKYLGVHISNF